MFFYFAAAEMDKVLEFINVHGFPHSYKKELHCTGGGGVRYEALLLSSTAYTKIINEDEMACLHRGILFLTGLKLKNEVFTVTKRGPTSGVVDEVR